MRKRWIWLGAMAAMLLLAAGCSGGGGGSSSVDVSLKEYSITPAVTTASGGTVTFNVTNDGAVAHEMVVVKTDVEAANLPVEKGEASEKGSVGEIADLPVGETKTLKLDLPAGHYVLLCNLPGHFTGGMHTDFTVT